MATNEKCARGETSALNGRRGTGISRYADYITKNSNSIPVYVGKTVIGYVSGGVFYKSVKGSKHFLRTPRAIAFDVSTLHDAEAAGAHHVEVTDMETGKTYRAAVSTIWAKGWEFNRGFGRQWGVPLAEWNRDNQEAGAAQLSLWGAS